MEKAGKLRISKSHYKRRLGRMTTDHDKLCMKVNELGRLKAQTCMELSSRGRHMEELQAKAEKMKKEAEEVVVLFRAVRSMNKP